MVNKCTIRQEALFKKIKHESSRIRNIVEFQSGCFPFRDLSTYREEAVRLFASHRKLVKEMRELSYEIRVNNLPECSSVKNMSTWVDSCETFTNWTAKYSYPNLRFDRIVTRGDTVLFGGGNDYRGVWQLLRNMFDDVSPIERWRRAISGSVFGNDNVVDVLADLVVNAELDGAIAVDLETTARSPMEGEIIELGLVEIRGNNPLDWPRFSMRFDLSSDDAKLLGTGAKWIHYIDISDISGEMVFTDSEVQEFLQQYLCSGRRLIFHNGAFEFKWLSHYLDGFFEANVDSFGFQRFMDTSILSKVAFQFNNGVGVSGNGLNVIANTLGFDYYNFAHTAMGDAGATALSMKLMVDLARGRNRTKGCYIANHDIQKFFTEPLMVSDIVH